MAPRRRGLLRSKSSVLVSVSDHDVGYLVYRFDVKRLFSDDDDGESKRRSRRRRRRPREVLPLPRNHVVCFRRPLRFPIALGASPGGDRIVAATTDGRIMVYDASRSQYTYDHHLGYWKRWPILLAAAAGSRPAAMSMVVATARPELSKPEVAAFEALRLTSGGRLEPLPVPPPLMPADWRCYDGYRPEVTCYSVAGGRVWLSLGDGTAKGTYSLDMAAAPKLKLGCCWRREGSWVLPLLGRAVCAPDLGLGRGLVLGWRREIRALCAVDIEASPPVIRQHWAWHTLFPTKDEGYSDGEDYLYYYNGGLAYLGGGRLCISWSSPFRDQGQRMMLALVAVELTVDGDGDLLLRKRRSRCYRLPPKNQKATVLPVL